MTYVVGRYFSALLLGCAGFVISSCTADKEPEVQAQQLAQEATQRVCDIFETCCEAANFPYQEQGCKAIYGPKIRQYFQAQTFLGAELDTEAAKRCLDAIGQVSDGCRSDRDRYLTEACDGLFRGTVPLGGECDPGHGCATTADAPLTCQRKYDDRSGYEYSGVCIAVSSGFVHNTLGQHCNESCADDYGPCVRSGYAGDAEHLADSGDAQGTCYASDGLFCNTELQQCQPQAVSGEPCQDAFACAARTYCDAESKCTPVRPLGASCTDSSQCGGRSYCNNEGLCQGAATPTASALLCAGQLIPPPASPGPITGG